MAADVSRCHQLQFRRVMEPSSVIIHCPVRRSTAAATLSYLVAGGIESFLEGAAPPKFDLSMITSLETPMRHATAFYVYEPRVGLV